MSEIQFMPIDGSVHSKKYDSVLAVERRVAVAKHRAAKRRHFKIKLQMFCLYSMITLFLMSVTFWMTASVVLTEQQIYTTDNGYSVILWGEEYLYEE